MKFGKKEKEVEATSPVQTRDDRSQPILEGQVYKEEIREHYAISDQEKLLLKHAFEESGTLFQLLSTLRTRRVGLGYQIETGEQESFDWSSGHAIAQKEGPLSFASHSDPVPLTELEEALLCWAALGPNGVILADIAVNGG
ncbi:MAG: hypothetical protein HKL80_10340, partial [Acidimicrobiales bacterium]|nr:hypothetical protein [Acidimicrobiales bacterium]